MTLPAQDHLQTFSKENKNKGVSEDLMQLFRSIVTIGGWTMGSRVLGFIRTILMASYLGAGVAADAIAIAIRMPSMLRRLFAEGAFSAAFVPIFAGDLATHGQEKALKTAEDIFNVLLWSLLALTIVCEIFMEPLMRALVPGFGPERLELTIYLTRITFPFIIFISLCAFYGGILNSYDRFTAFAASPMAGNAWIIGAIVFLTPQMSEPSLSFALALLGCGVVQFFWVYIPAKQSGIHLRIQAPRLSPDVRKFLKILGPSALGSGVVQVNLFIGSMIASLLPTGGVAILTYADRLCQLPISVIGTAMGTALLPILSRQIRSGEIAKAKTCLRESLELSLLLSVPAAIGLVVLADPLITIFFVHGKFDAGSGALTAATLKMFSLGLPAYILVKVFSATFFAQKAPKVPLVTGALTVIIDVVLSLLLIEDFGAAGIGIATAAASWFNVILLAILLSKRGFSLMDSQLSAFLLRLCITVVGSTAILTLLKAKFEPWFEMALYYQAAGIMILVLIVLLSFFGLAQLTGTVSLSEFKGKLSRKPVVSSSKEI